MQKLDRLGWADGMAFEAFGKRVGIRVNVGFPEELRAPVPYSRTALAAGSRVDQLYSLLLHGDSGDAHVRRFNLAYVGASLIGRSLDRKEITSLLTSDLHRYLAEFSRREIFVHAGVVAWRGRAILIPGSSYSGKSTLVAELVRAGATYYSDEYAVLERGGRVHPYPRPLQLRTQKQAVPDFSNNGGSAKAPALPVRLVVLTRYRDGANWRPRNLSRSKALLGLLSHTVQARSRPQAALSVLQRVAQNCISLSGARGEARPTAEALLAMLEDS
jgi:hypothetical protein